MQDYAVVEEALRQRLITHFSNQLSDTRCVAGDIDALLRAIFDEEDTYFGCLLEFGMARELIREPFKAQIWATQIVGIFMIRYSPDVEDNLRLVLKNLRTLCKDDPRLGGTVDRARVIRIDTPEPVQVEDIGFYFVPFTVEVWERAV